LYYKTKPNSGKYIDIYVIGQLQAVQIAKSPMVNLKESHKSTLSLNSSFISFLRKQKWF